MYKPLIIGLLAATTVAGMSVAREMRHRSVVTEEQKIVAVPGCTSFAVYDYGRQESKHYKRQRKCIGETQ